MLKTLFIFLLCLNIYAQEDSVYTLSPVEVTAGRTLLNNFQSHALIEQNAIQTGETGLSLQESLYIVPGLIINNRNNPSMGDKISIRGIGSRASFGVRGLKILLDNIPLTLPDGQTQTNNIELLSTGKIEVLKGPASSLYGNASGGIINIKTELPSNRIINISPQIIWGENNLLKYSLKLSGSTYKHSYLLNFVNTDYRGFREHSAMKIYHLNSLYRYYNDNVKLTAIINYFNSPYLQNPSSITKEASENSRTITREFIKQQGAGEKASQFQTGATINYSGNNFNLETTVYYQNRDLVNPIPGRIIELKRNAGGIRSSAASVFMIESFRINLSGGIDVERQQDDRVEFLNNGLPHLYFEPAEVFENILYGDKLLEQEESITGVGPFVSVEMNFNNGLGIMGVIRYDHFTYDVEDFFSDNSGSRVMSKFNPSSGILYRTDNGSRIYFNYSTSFQTPTTAELSNREDGLGGFNPDLDPESISQFEIGSDYLFNSLNTRISAALYYMNFKNLLLPYQSNLSEEIFYKNAGGAVNKGIEVQAEYKPDERMRLNLSFNLMKFIYEDYIIEFEENLFQLKGNYIPGIPGKTIAFDFGYFMESGIWMKANLQWNDKFFTNDFNGSSPESLSPENNFLNHSYLIANLRFGYTFELPVSEGNLFFGVNNIFNVKYNGSVVPNAAGERFFEPSPGRNVYTGLNVSF